MCPSIYCSYLRNWVNVAAGEGQVFNRGLSMGDLFFSEPGVATLSKFGYSSILRIPVTRDFWNPKSGWSFSGFWGCMQLSRSIWHNAIIRLLLDCSSLTEQKVAFENVPTPDTATKTAPDGVDIVLCYCVFDTIWWPRRYHVVTGIPRGHPFA